MSTVKVLVLRSPGINCDREAVFAWRRVGAVVEYVHLNRLVDRPRLLGEFQVLTIPGGFSYGDDIAAGKIFATKLKLGLVDAIREFVDRGNLVIGICNGFQILAKAGLLPGMGEGGPRCTLAMNESGRFEDRWIRLEVATEKSPWLKKADRFAAPVAHGEGRVVFDSPQTLDRVRQSGQVALRYISETGAASTYPANPNGSVDAIAGLIDPTGRILGLMPHPERHIDWTQNPAWTAKNHASDTLPDEHGLRVFQRGIEYFT